MNHLELNWRWFNSIFEGLERKKGVRSWPYILAWAPSPLPAGLGSQANRKVRVQIGGAASDTAGVLRNWSDHLFPSPQRTVAWIGMSHKARFMAHCLKDLKAQHLPPKCVCLSVCGTLISETVQLIGITLCMCIVNCPRKCSADEGAILTFKLTMKLSLHVNQEG